MLTFDLHIHSRYSFDSYLDPSCIVEAAKRKGLTGIAVVDHNTIQGAVEAEKIAKQELIVICATEINTEIGDVVGLFINRDIRARKFEDVVSEIKAQGGIAVLAHPYKRKRTVTPEILQKIDAVESFNARNGINNREAMLLARRYNLPVVGGSDAHFAFEIGRGRTLLDGSTNIDSASLKEKILSGQTKTTGEDSSPFLELLSQGLKALKRKSPCIRF
jgi:hypothetical protein